MGGRRRSIGRYSICISDGHRAPAARWPFSFSRSGGACASNCLFALADGGQWVLPLRATMDLEASSPARPMSGADCNPTVFFFFFFFSDTQREWSDRAAVRFNFQHAKFQFQYGCSLICLLQCCCSRSNASWGPAAAGFQRELVSFKKSRLKSMEVRKGVQCVQPL